eukprot:TRINITY_DN14876_c0_g1_i1.p1 TRINITY_DN14876_c0_g1~~TRINITY_DN14876_c0_g1_i1.p1  ORF type:complete len:258 (+),score=60.25 TRINITY_DN14876_c0_g1_i1:39-812(+)
MATLRRRIRGKRRQPSPSPVLCPKEISTELLEPCFPEQFARSPQDSSPPKDLQASLDAAWEPSWDGGDGSGSRSGDGCSLRGGRSPRDINHSSTGGDQVTGLCDQIPAASRRTAALLLEAIFEGIEALGSFKFAEPAERCALLESIMEAVEQLADRRWPLTAKLRCQAAPRDKQQAAERPQSGCPPGAESKATAPTDIGIGSGANEFGDDKAEEETSGQIAENSQMALPFFPHGGHEVVEDLDDWASRSIQKRRRLS